MVVTTFDENYLMPGLVASVSAIEHAPEDVVLRILGVGLSDKAIDIIEAHTPPDRTEVLDAAQLTAGLPNWRHLSSAAWARVGIASLLPDEVERIVYVDADSFTRRSIAGLFEMDLRGRTIAACIDPFMPTHRARHEWGSTQESGHTYRSDTSLPASQTYFNSGVLSIDLKAWRERTVEERILEVAGRLPGSYFLLDQDVMNQVLSDDWFPLDWRQWNWPGYLKAPEAWDAHVTHFLSSPKPWVSRPLGAPFNREYSKAAARVGWALQPETERFKSGIIEMITPHSLVVRRKRIARAIRGSSRGDQEPLEASTAKEHGRKGSSAIVVAFDERYLRPGLVAAHTAMKHAPDDTLVFVLGVGLSASGRRRIADVIDRDRLEIVDAASYVSGLPDTMPAAAWARIGMGDALPASVARVVYLDSDTMTRGDLAPLFEMNLEGKVLAAAIEEPDPSHRGRHRWGQSINPSLDFLADSEVPDVAAYFNSGVLAVDMTIWRETGAGERLRLRAETLPASYVLPDQDLLNVVLWRDWLPLDWRIWNWPGLMLDRLAWESNIVHFKGPTKPWVSSPLGAPFSQEYRAAAEEVGWMYDASRYRIRWGVAEALLPHSIILRRREFGRRIAALRDRALT